MRRKWDAAGSPDHGSETVSRTHIRHLKSAARRAHSGGGGRYVGQIMNLTVGPLPPAVYWRRRAIVAAGLLAIILPIAFSCGGPGKSDPAGQRKTAVTVSQHPSP